MAGPLKIISRAKPVAVAAGKPALRFPLKSLAPVAGKPVVGKPLARFPLKFKKPSLKLVPKGSQPPPKKDESFASKRYELRRMINEGGMGTIYQAWDTILGMEVALKMLRPEIAKDADSVAQLKSEAAVAMKLSHENIVRLHNIEIEKDHIFIVMEYVEGQTLRAIIQDMGPLALEAVLDIAHACSSALSYAHERGILHRDIKLDNLMINNDMTLKLLDFGIALKVARGRDQSEFLEGSPGYMSPEQLHGLPVDVRTDVFSMAVVLCELLTGLRTFPNVDDLHQMYDTAPMGLETVPASVAEVLRKGLALDVNDRWPTVQQFYHAFEHALKPLI
ncbi:MAG: serine/threonine-protein kinase [bacterium]